MSGGLWKLRGEKVMKGFFSIRLGLRYSLFFRVKEGYCSKES